MVKDWQLNLTEEYIPWYDLIYMGIFRVLQYKIIFNDDASCFRPRERSVLWTLLKFTLAMILLPISSFFLTKSFVFEG